MYVCDTVLIASSIEDHLKKLLRRISQEDCVNTKCASANIFMKWKDSGDLSDGICIENATSVCCIQIVLIDMLLIY